MIRQVNLDMDEYRGKSTDTKPSGVANGATFLEIDTGAKYMYDEENGEWCLMPSNINAEASIRATTDAFLQSQIDQIIAPTGEAPSAAEVENARIGADGVTYSTLGEAIRANDSLLKSQIDTKAYEIENLEGNLPIVWEQGSINNLGEESSATNRIRTTYVDVTNAKTLKLILKVGYSINILRYTADKTVLGTSTYIDGDVVTTRDITVTDLAYVRLVVKKNDDSDITLSAGFGIGIVKTTVLTESIDVLQKDAVAMRSLFQDVVSGIADGTIVITVDENSLIAGNAIDGSGATITSNSSYCTDFIDAYDKCWVNSVLEYNGNIASTWYHYVCFYDKNKTFISRIGNKKIATVYGQIPDNTAYIRVSLTYINLSALEHYTLTQSTHVASPSNKWYVLGDSISAGYYSMTASMAQAAGVTFDYNSPVTTEGGEATGSVWDETLKHNYWGYANKWILKRNLVGKAYPGQGYYRTASNSQNGVYVVTHNDFSDAGLITVAWGFNDWHYNQNRGDHTLIDASVPYPGENYDTTQITTVNQAIWYCLGELIRKAPNAKIVVQTPMNGWAYGGDFASNWGIGTSLSRSGSIADIHDDIVYWANYYGLQILDMTYNNSIVNRRNIKDTLIDGSHPSDAAHQQLGRHVAEFLGYC